MERRRLRILTSPANLVDIWKGWQLLKPEFVTVAVGLGSWYVVIAMGVINFIAKSMVSYFARRVTRMDSFDAPFAGGDEFNNGKSIGTF